VKARTAQIKALILATRGGAGTNMPGAIVVYILPRVKGVVMKQDAIPGWYTHTKEKYPQFAKALEQLGETVRKEGPLDEKTSHLIQLAAAVAIRSEGAVHSHARRAVQAGATAEEIHHAVLLLTSTIGFPSTSAALSWVYDILDAKSES
jgi:4-carboxymuconolactone decarboxylase